MAWLGDVCSGTAACQSATQGDYPVCGWFNRVWRPIEPLQTNWFVDLLWFRHFKFQFSVLTGADTVLWSPLCQWLVRQAKLDGLQVVSIQLIREYQTVNAPTAAQPLTDWQSFVMHEEKFV
ncbi:MAG: hypothetical protein DWI22_18415 [Planctomycetota bacterium]|nr:MAG: hypothetical protein DWI22_18415 [Planctomycetota bacterium]